MKESFVRGERVVVPEFEIHSNPVVRLADIKERKYNVIDRATKPARGWYMSEIMGIGVVNPWSITTIKEIPLNPQFTNTDRNPEDEFFEEV